MSAIRAAGPALKVRLRWRSLLCGCDVGDGRVRARGMHRRRCSASYRKVQSQESTSMLDQPVSQAPDVVAAHETTGRIDRSMDALQYVLAFVAIVIAAVLASIR
jgi:hypothetical protein